MSAAASETVFVTGGTGFLGSYVVDRLISDTDSKLLLLTRAQSKSDATNKLWRAMQLHWSSDTFRNALARIEFVSGDLQNEALGMVDAARTLVTTSADSVLHIAASLNRKSEKACLNANLRGTLHVLQLCDEIQARSGLRRYSHVSTVAVAGERSNETVGEDSAIEWDRSDYDPYARTKKFAEYMGRNALPGVSKIFFRPSIVMGDSRFAATTQFDMVRAYCALADLPVLPFGADTRLDIVPANFVGDAIATLHMRPDAPYDTYHLSSGIHSVTVGEVCNAIATYRNRRPPRYVPQMGASFERLIELMNLVPRQSPLGRPGEFVQQIGALLKVFWPYITYNTVFDNSRVVAELGKVPAAFSRYCGPLYDFAKAHRFRYPHVTLEAADSTASESTKQP